MKQVPSRIAFGSCNEQDLQNNMWPIIEKRDPVAFIWGGDAIYAGTYVCKNLEITRNFVLGLLLTYKLFSSDADYQLPTEWTKFPPISKHKCADPARLRTLYKEQKSIPAYKRLLKSNLTVFGTFDGMSTYTEQTNRVCL